jgi:DNA-directed RNA polymerase specialized sigma24 family protein
MMGMVFRDDDPFRRFVTDQWGPLHRTAYLWTGDAGTAEDLVQSALEKAHRPVVRPSFGRTRR